MKIDAWLDMFWDGTQGRWRPVNLTLDPIQVVPSKGVKRFKTTISLTAEDLEPQVDGQAHAIAEPEPPSE